MRKDSPVATTENADLHEYARIFSVQTRRGETPAHARRVMGAGQHL